MGLQAETLDLRDDFFDEFFAGLGFENDDHERLLAVLAKKKQGIIRKCCGNCEWGAAWGDLHF